MTRCLILLETLLDDAQVVRLEAVEATEDPSAFVVLVGIGIGTLNNLLANFVLFASLSQLFHKVFNVVASLIVEQFHVVEDALDVAPSLLIVCEIPLLVLRHGRFLNFQLIYTLGTVLCKILSSLDAPFGVALRSKKNPDK